MCRKKFQNIYIKHYHFSLTVHVSTISVHMNSVVYEYYIYILETI